MSDLMLDVGQANEIKMALRRAKFTSEEVERLSEGNTLAQVRSVLRGFAEVRFVGHVVDRTKAPNLPFPGCVIYEHNGNDLVRLELRSDDLYLDNKKVVLRVVENNFIGCRLTGHEVYSALGNSPVLDASVLDYLLEHLELIPESWKVNRFGHTQSIFFWGTIFRDSSLPRVRCLFWDDVCWNSNSVSLDVRCFGNRSPAAVLGS